MICLRAPAKLNLYLRVLGRRPDGYHELETLFERIDLADDLTFEPHPHELRLTCTDLSAVPPARAARSAAGGGTAPAYPATDVAAGRQAGPTLSCGEDNLVIKTARLLQAESRTSLGARMHLVKRIPIAAGLGGGSSDAAATLLGLNELWALRWPRARLLELAACLGCDVPFFLADAPFAIGRGRGERCEPIAAPAQLTHLLIVPNAQLSTKEVYEGARFDPVTPVRDDLTGLTPSLKIVQHALSNGSPSELAPGMWNDLEPEAIRRCPVISLIRSHLREHGCLAALVSGSGPSVFGLCRDVAQAQEVAAGLRRRSEARSWRIELIQTDHRPSLVAAPSVS